MTAPSDQEQPVEGTDDQSYDAAEAAIAAAIAAVLIAWLLHPRIGRVAARRRQVDSAVGPAVRSLLQRTAFGMYQQAGQSSTPGAADVEETYPAVMDRLFGWMEQGYRRLSAAGSRRDEPNPADVRTFADNLARSITTDAHTSVQNRVASKLGAVWSEWVSRHDRRVRDSHRELDGQKIPFGSKFVTEAGILIARPGDPEAPLSETLGCRCHLRYRLRPHGQDDLSEV